MGSLENNTHQLPLKRDSLLRSSSAVNRNFNNQKPIRSRFSRFFLLKKLDYLQWTCTVIVFLCFVVIFQMFLPGSVDTNDLRNDGFVVSGFGDLSYLKELGVLDFGDDVEFYPYKVLERFSNNGEINESSGVKRLRFGYRKPQLAIIFADLEVDPQQLLMVTVATALQEIGYAIQVFSLEDGPIRDVWKNIGVPVTIFSVNQKTRSPIDWLNFDGALVNSFEAKGALSCFMQEPFRSVPLIWNIQNSMLATRTREYASNGQVELVNDWKKAFNRATVVVFPNHFLPMMYSTFDTGNYYVIPGTPAEAWEANFKMASYKENAREHMGYGPDDIVIAVVGSQFLYKGMWLEHALILQALLPLFVDSPIDSHLNSNMKVMVLSGDSSGNYTAVVEAIAFNLSYPRDVLKHRVIDGDANVALSVADLIVYGSFLEEKSFPEVLIKSMCLEKPIIAPDLSAIRQYVDDRVNGYLFPKEDLKVLTQSIMQLISNGKLSPLARNVASMGKGTAKDMMVRDAIEGYATLLGYVLKFPSEVEPPKAVTEIPTLLKEKWRWHLFESFFSSQNEDRILKSARFFVKYEEQWNNTLRVNSGSIVAPHESFIYEIWEEEKNNQMLSVKKRREDEELKDRTDQPHGTWEDVYRSAKRADRSKNDLRERDEGELERTGQPLCIYEPYFGEGTWSFLHRHSLYRGIGLSTKGRRAGTDDIEGPSRLPLLSNPYYRDALGEYGAFFAIANRIDRIHKNAWIGFQSWRATARNESLSRTAEKQLLEAIQSRRHGDALYFWIRMDRDPRNRKTQNFWSFCDALNAGNCKMAFSEALRKMYGVKHDLDSLPPMPEDGDTWSVSLSWALPTRSFLEFVMFSRMFVDALDAQMYDEHHQTGYCCLSLYKDRHCYLRLLELLVNVWAYHSARHMVYVDPETGLMQEQHKLKGRRGKMWIKWFSYTTLKSMDEDLAEEADSDRLKKRWLWPSTGEVVWQGVFEKERNLRNQQKEKRKQQSKEKLNRMRKKHHQKVIGKYVKPPPEDTESSNSTTTAKTSGNL